jgi:hypothetical protein
MVLNYYRLPVSEKFRTVEQPPENCCRALRRYGAAPQHATTVTDARAKLQLDGQTS